MYLHGPQTTTTTTTTTKDNRQFVKTETTSGPSAAQVLARGGLTRCSRSTPAVLTAVPTGALKRVLTGYSQRAHKILTPAVLTGVLADSLNKRVLTV